MTPLEVENHQDCTPRVLEPLPPEWYAIHDELPRRGQDVWLYDSMFGTVTAWTVVCTPDRIDGDISHWMPRKGMAKPKPPADASVHANGFPK